MKKMLITLTTVGVLAVPAGLALAQSDTPEPAGPVPTCVDPVRDRDRDRSASHESQDQVRTQLQTQLRLEDGTCDHDGTGDQVRSQTRVHQQSQLQDRTQLTDGAGDRAMTRSGAMGHAPNG
jgi:hypothetical protein